MLLWTRARVLLDSRKTTNLRLLLGKNESASHDSLEAATRALEQAEKLSACGFVASAPFTTSREFLARSRARGRQTERPSDFHFFSSQNTTPRRAARRSPYESRVPAVRRSG